MLVVDRERIRETGAIVRWVDTGKQFPEIYAHKKQVEAALDIHIVTVPLRITFEQFLFEKGGMVRKGTNDCSRRMKRANLMAHLKTFERPYEVNLGYNCDEEERAESFTDLNERPWCHWRFPLLEKGINRPHTQHICAEAGFTVLIEMYRKMGRMDCYFCGNQTAKQALKVAEHYPAFAEEWIGYEKRKGHSFLPLPLEVLIAEDRNQGRLFGGSQCACFGGSENVWED